MRPSQAHFVTTCQQLLALGAVLAVLTPAAAVINLDVVRQAPLPGPGAGAGSGHPVELTAAARAARQPARVPTGPVDAEVTEHQLTAEPGASGRRAVEARTVADARAGTRLLSRPQPVTGYAGVGITWDPAARATDEDLAFEVRGRTAGEWAAWTPVEFHTEHAPDPHTREGRRARPGTDVIFLGEVDEVQVRATADGIAPPAGMRLAVVTPGRPPTTARELPELDPVAAPRAATTAATDEANPRLATYTPRPRIFSRAQWGANEDLRDKGSLRYFEVHAGFVHHTVNANDYTRSQVPGLLRSIYAYHTQSRGWSDVGYNFLVDRFGRIWEGRYGGVDRPVVGAHTLGYNDHAFAMSAIGNFDVKQPGRAMIQAYGALFAWKLSLHGVDAGSGRQWVGTDWFPAINGHRDAGSTACPGRYLYARLGRIRTLAEAAQQDWSGRELQSDLAGTDHPDLVVRRASDKRVFVLPTGGLTAFRKPVVTTGAAAGADAVVASPDLTGDGVGDVLVRGEDGSAKVLPGTGTGGFGAAVRSTAAFAGRDLITAVGDLDGDGHHDLVARDPAAGVLHAYLGTGSGGFGRQRVPGDWAGYRALVATGDLDGDGHVDLLAQDDAGALWALPGTAGLGFGSATKVSGGWGKWATITGYGDLTRDGRPDLVVRGDGRAPGWVVPAVGEFEFGQPLGPVGRFKGAGPLAGAAPFAGDALPDVVSRRGQDLRTYVNAGTVELHRPLDTGIRLRGADALFSAGDWDRDGHGDLVHRTRRGALVLRQGDGTGGFGDPVRLARGFGDVRLLAAVGDMTGDGWPDLMGQPSGSSMRIYPGNGLQGLRPGYVAHSAIDAARQVPVGRWDTDGAPDSLFRSGSSLALYPGNGPGGLVGRQALQADLTGFDWVVGVSDLRLTGHGDLIVREKATGRLYAWQATASKGLTSRRLLGEGMGIYDLAG